MFGSHKVSTKILREKNRGKVEGNKDKKIGLK